jgi:hypothetical protein
MEVGKMKIDWTTTILTIIGAVLGQALAANVSAIGDLIPVAGTSIGTLLSVIVGGGIGGAVAGMLGRSA